MEIKKVEKAEPVREAPKPKRPTNNPFLNELKKKMNIQRKSVKAKEPEKEE